jgi:hypothetical protein
MAVAPPPTAAQDDLILKFLRGVRDLISDLITVLESPAGRAALMADIGLAPPIAGDVSGKVSLARQALQSADMISADDITLEELANAAQAITAAALAVNDIIKAAQDPTSNAGWDLAEDVINIASLAVIRNRYPRLWTVARLLGFLEGQRIRIDRLGKLIADPKEFFNDLAGGTQPALPEDIWAGFLGAATTIFEAVARSKEWMPAWTLGTPPDITAIRLEFRTQFGWEQYPASPHPNADAVLNRATTFQLVASEVKTADSGDTHLQQTLFLTMIPVPPAHGGAQLFIRFTGDLDFRLPLSKGWEIRALAKAPAVIDAGVGHNSFFTVTTGEAGLTLGIQRPDDDKGRWTLGNTKSVYLEIGKASLLGTVGPSSTTVTWKQSDSGLVIKSGDSFLKAFLSSDGLRLDADIGLTLDTTPTIKIDGGAKLKATLPINKTVFGIEVQSITVGIDAESASGVETFGLEISGSFGITIAGGVVVFAVQRIGVTIGLKHDPAAPGGAGPLGQPTVGFKSPTGIGAAVKAAVISGGGFLSFDPDAGEYSGVIELKLGVSGFPGIDIKAIAILGTKLPDGQPGFSLLVIATVEFSPSIQIFSGFDLVGVGLLVGIHHTVATDQLEAAVHNKALDSILFPQDPVAHAARIIQTLKGVFPIDVHSYVFGIMVKIGWAKDLCTIALGVIAQFPEGRIALLGSLQLVLAEPKAPVALIRIDFTGIIDIPASDLTFDGALVNSRLVTSPLSGDFKALWNWGANQNFVFAAGGFHPRFVPPAGFTSINRLRIDLTTTANPRLRAESYLAVASNSLQFGCRAELYAAAAGFEVAGNVSFDAIIIWKPTFGFGIDLHAGIALRSGGSTIASLDLNGQLSGPAPWHIHGDASLTILFWSVSVTIDSTWGPPASGTSLPLANAVDQTTQALSDPTSWSAEFTSTGSRLVTLTKRDLGQVVLAHPLGVIRAEQRVLPLGLALDHIGQSNIDGPNKVDITGVSLPGATATPTEQTELFAAGVYKDLSESDKLTRPAFEPMQAGVRIARDDYSCGPPIESDLTYETIRLSPVRPTPGQNAKPGGQANATLLALASLGGAGRADRDRTTHSGLSIPVTVSGSDHSVVASTKDLTKASDPMLAKAQTYSLASQALDAHLAANPQDAGAYQVVGAHEAVTP